MDGGGTQAVSVGQGSDVTRCQFEMMQGPIAGHSPLALYLDEPGRGSREQRYLETIERDRQAVTDCFDVCFFSRPAAEKSEASLLGFQREQLRNFGGGKEAGGD